jgi:predicted nucleotidyltransferase component of viral defense system
MTADYTKHKSIMLQILKDIYTDTALAPLLGFKGGTAAMLFHDLDRHSVDIDFDLLDDAQKDFVFERVREIAKRYGSVEDDRIKRFNIFMILSYAPGAQKIKIEINRRQFGSEYEVLTHLGISMLVMVKRDMFAHKLMAMYERIGKTSRDIFDVYCFFKEGWEINHEIVEQRSGLPFREALKQCVTVLEQTDNRHILDGLGELLDEPQKDWARAKLKSDTLFFLRMAIENES